MTMLRNTGAGAPPPGKEGPSELTELNQRSREIFRHIVETYLSTGEPVGSRNLARGLPMTLSPASVRNVMADLEGLGLIYAPHTSAGRLPTETGLRLFVDALLEVGDLSLEERKQIEAQVGGKQRKGSLDAVLAEASEMISGLSQCAGVVLTEKQTAKLKQVEFVRIEPERALVVLVSEDGRVENRIIDVPKDLPSSALVEAANFFNCQDPRLDAAGGAHPHRARDHRPPGRGRPADRQGDRSGSCHLVGRRDAGASSCAGNPGCSRT